MGKLPVGVDFSICSENSYGKPYDPYQPVYHDQGNARYEYVNEGLLRPQLPLAHCMLFPEKFKAFCTGVQYNNQKVAAERDFTVTRCVHENWRDKYILVALNVDEYLDCDTEKNFPEMKMNNSENNSKSSLLKKHFEILENSDPVAIENQASFPVDRRLYFTNESLEVAFSAETSDTNSTTEVDDFPFKHDLYYLKDQRLLQCKRIVKPKYAYSMQVHTALLKCQSSIYDGTGNDDV